VEIRVKGDGKTYKLGLRDDAALDGVMYQAAFRTETDVWQQIMIPFSEFVPTYHGRRLESEPTLDKSRIKSFSFLISDTQEGPFALEIAWVRCF
jgi:monofunctional biosynthetic peptidoglycan transglycosylase